ncbi:MAG TPA: GNAT family N-acetyltransferase [Caulobacteraceae bacterium]|jgi:RimJ/RimL family protein N-acetyltransferase|nr:GNAT family N-acetyltransferase [Caulobacteraceae bacterium]
MVVDAEDQVATRRLTLRAPRMAEAVRIAALADDFELASMTTGVPHPCLPQHAEDFIARGLRAEPQRERLFAIDAAGQGAIGVIGLHPNDAGATEVGYWLGRAYWGQGYMTEALEGALDWAAREWGRRRIVSGHFADNEASAAVLIKAGFLYTGDVLLRRSMARDAPTPTRMMIWLA